MINHDEKKIEEIVTSEATLIISGVKVYEKSVSSMKQYAEHMVQQERERVLKIMYRYELQPEGCYGCGGYSLVDTTKEVYPHSDYHCDYDLGTIINLINKEDE